MAVPSLPPHRGSAGGVGRRTIAPLFDHVAHEYFVFVADVVGGSAHRTSRPSWQLSDSHHPIGWLRHCNTTVGLKEALVLGNDELAECPPWI